ncbi:unnamed protein product [Linum trigynum]|uniref:CLAVATA3/ESR (CLE)-related protein 13 n=1 Tax=Linum trigynum TaxID=586398 RepID=A0AAV2F4A0_9ROSI
MAAAILKLPSLALLLLLLWLSLLFHEFYGFKRHTVITSNPSTFHASRPAVVVNHRKVLASNFDFSQFRKPTTTTTHHHHHHRVTSSPPPEIDPRYGVDKRLVPTGPNPLHH